jgi:CheY-like chemotaxis protein
MREKTIMLVEDNPDDVQLNLRALQQFHLRNKLVVLQDGAQALAYLFREGNDPALATGELPAVILLDLHLPKVDGLEVLRQIRAHPTTKHIPVIVLTASQDEKDLISSYDLGCNSFIRKPVDFGEFIQAVRQLGMYWLLLNEAPPNGNGK